MSKIELKKIVVLGWNNFTASLIDGVKKKYPHCVILCPDPMNEFIQQCLNYGFLDPLPKQKVSIYEDADFVIIDQTPQETCATLSEIKSLLSVGTYIMDFQPVKTDFLEKMQAIIGPDNPYVSCFAFLDEIPREFTIRGDIFKDKIIAVVCDTSTQILQEIRDFWNIFNAKIVPTSGDFFDEILSETSQSVSLIAHMFTHILQQDSWADTLFFGFYNKDLRSFLNPAGIKQQHSAESILHNADNIRRNLSFIKREIDKIDQMIDDEDTLKLSQYLISSHNFKNRL